MSHVHEDSAHELGQPLSPMNTLREIFLSLFVTLHYDCYHYLSDLTHKIGISNCIMQDLSVTQ